MRLCTGRYKRFSDSTNVALLAWLVVVVIAAILPYVPSLDGEFVVDDHELIVDNPIVHRLSTRIFAYCSSISGYGIIKLPADRLRFGMSYPNRVRRVGY